MKRAERDEWCKRLESGAYKQGRSFLRLSDEEGDKFCCLGVYADMKDPTAWASPDDPDTEITDSAAYSWHGDMEILGDETDPVFFDLIGDGIGRTYQDVLANKNDSPTSFKDIANWIRQYFPVED